MHRSTLYTIYLLAPILLFQDTFSTLLLTLYYDHLNSLHSIFSTTLLPSSLHFTTICLFNSDMLAMLFPKSFSPFLFTALCQYLLIRIISYISTKLSLLCLCYGQLWSIDSSLLWYSSICRTGYDLYFLLWIFLFWLK